jgi:hypothetical protein
VPSTPQNPDRQALNTKELRTIVRADSVRRSLLVLVAVLAAATVAAELSTRLLGHGRIHGLVPLLDATDERSAATWISSLIFLLCALLAAISARLETTRSSARRWWLLAVVLVAAAADDMLQIHETLGEELGRQLVDTGGFLTYAWVVPGAALTLALIAGLWPLFSGMARPARRPALLGVALFLGAALLLELPESRFGGLEGSGALTGEHALSIAQEITELVGVVLLLDGLLRHVALSGVPFRTSVLLSASQTSDQA